MTAILFIHLIAIGIWAGCVATEVVCELDQKDVKFRDSYIATLHWKIDKFVEIPAILVAAFTGLFMLQGVTWTLLVGIKVGAGVSAVVLNTIAAYTISQRYKHFTLDNEEQYLRYNKLHDLVGYGCVISIVVAIVAGGLNIAG